MKGRDMGQYYKPVNESKKQFLLSHDYDNGLKLMEHSYLGNTLVMAVEQLVGEGGAWSGDVVRWEGDYNNAPDGTEAIQDTRPNRYSIASEQYEKLQVPVTMEDSRRYVLNDSRRVFIDTAKVEADAYGLRVHPMPLMLADANGRGGGDYSGADEELVGTWAGDVVRTADEVPAGYSELEVHFQD